ncbi:polyprenyl synthetase family protein [Humibacter ginsenosidimutans]|uniref:Polyprenyl synthetase family protein n=1 Tax=Humibacter ginsenosidimutans TaxID=2599293 RepID=A0A5B8LYS9_9MICO|nr:polyprenyl synthetase family protein [Humibacter ginsenosidimutans]
MPGTDRLIDLVDERIGRFLETRESIVLSIAPEIGPLASFSRQFLSGGKRFRALFCYWGYESVEGARDRRESERLDAVIGTASALELFHAAALVHDDIIDRSDLRRGAPSAHRRFESLHREHGWDGRAEDFGDGAAILLGDLLLGYSDDLLAEALADGVDAARAVGVRREFGRMRAEVIAGQYLDILEERSWRAGAEDDHLSRAERVIVYKSAKYSVQAPLLLGGLLAGGTLGQLDALREFGLPLGIAFQLRDDLLGVFGDATVTGKPSGDDLREGKRTVLIALARRSLPSSARRVLDELLGDPELDDDQIRMLQNTITSSGATAEVERMIALNVERASHALDDAPLADVAVNRLRELTRSVSDRVA